MVPAAFDLWGGAVIAVAVSVAFLAEQRHPLRRRTRPLGERLATNVVLVVLAGLALRLARVPAAVAVATASERSGVGLLRWLAAPPALAAVLGLVLRDWTV